MVDDDLEKRLARLERRTRIYQLVAVASLLFSAALLANACGSKEARLPGQIELKSKDTTVTLADYKLALKRGNHFVEITPEGLTVENGRKKIRVAIEDHVDGATPAVTIEDGDKRLTANTDGLSIKGSAGQAALKPGQFSLEDGESKLEARVSRDDSGLELQHGIVKEGPRPQMQTHVRLITSETFSSVTAGSDISPPDEKISAGLYSDGRGAAVLVDRIGDRKSLATDRKK
jgi:hypothetical protein